MSERKDSDRIRPGRGSLPYGSSNRNERNGSPAVLPAVGWTKHNGPSVRGSAMQWPGRVASARNSVWYRYAYAAAGAAATGYTIGAIISKVIGG